MKILFRKILDYDLRRYESDAFIYVCRILSQKINPDSLKKQSFAPTTKITFHSELKRAKQCLKKNKSFKLIPTKFLNEIPFNLDNYCNELEYKKEGSVVVRRAFKKLFIENKLMINRNKIFNEIEKLFTYLKNNSNSENNVTVFSHSFRLKCIEAYLKTNKQIIKSPELIGQYISDKNKTFDFGKGFDFDI